MTTPVRYRVIGVMSGTSTDGLDLACCDFTGVSGKWEFSMKAANTFPYDGEWSNRLQNAARLDERGLDQLDREYGSWIAMRIVEFCEQHSLDPKLIASHGHTVLHRPGEGITYQAGSGAVIATSTGITTISNFRKKDVELGGQGAPLAPVGDRYLFGGYEGCLNLGGFCNISYESSGSRIGYDLAPCNLALNYLSKKSGRDYDHSGMMGRRGHSDSTLLSRLNNLKFYGIDGPRSLGREWLESEFLPLIDQAELEQSDQMRTVYEHIAFQTGRNIEKLAPGRVLLSGGGAHNSFLVELIARHTQCRLIMPDPLIVDFKEALIFGFLGLLKYLGMVNCFASVTGAARDSDCGEVFTP